MRIVSLGIVCTLCVATVLIAQPQNEAADANLFVISPMRVQQMQGSHYLHKTIETSYAEMHQPVMATMEQFEKGIDAGRIKVRGPAVFVYHGATMDPAKKFKLEVGFPVDADTADVDGFTVRQLEPVRCATVIYSGPVHHIGKAYEKLFKEMAAAGLEAGEEFREMHLMFESPESPNNVALIQVSLK